MDLEVIDLYNNEFMKLNNKINKDELNNYINRYIIVKSLVISRMREQIYEGVYILKEVFEDCIKVNSLNNNSLLVIEFNRLLGYEVLPKKNKIIDILNNLDNNNYLVEITNIYNKKIKVLLNEFNVNKETDKITFTYKFKYKDNDYNYDTANYVVGLIKDINIIEEYKYNDINLIIKYIEDYYCNNFNDLIKDNNYLINIIKVIYTLINIDIDYLASYLHISYNLIKDITNNIKVDNNLKINKKDIKFILDNF